MTVSYSAALEWLAADDAIDWLYQEPLILTPPAALVCDLWRKSDKEFRKDLKKVVSRNARKANVLHVGDIAQRTPWLYGLTVKMGGTEV